MGSRLPPSVPTARYVGFSTSSFEPGRRRREQTTSTSSSTTGRRDDERVSVDSQTAVEGNRQSNAPAVSTDGRVRGLLVDCHESRRTRHERHAATSSCVIARPETTARVSVASDGQQGEPPELLAAQRGRPLHRLRARSRRTWWPGTRTASPTSSSTMFRRLHDASQRRAWRRRGGRGELCAYSECRRALRRLLLVRIEPRRGRYEWCGRTSSSTIARPARQRG